MDKDKLTAKLASGSVETLEDGKNYIDISSKVMDCVLIIGKVLCDMPLNPSLKYNAKKATFCDC